MQNKWTASVEKEDDNTEGKIPEKNNSKKIGLAMGVVGAVLVTAGAAPMLFGNSDNLTGDATGTQQEAVDPLVALLSGGDTTPTESKTPTATPKATVVATPVATVNPTKAPKQTKAPQKQEALTPVTTNKNTKESDKTGEKFTNTNVMHNASALTNSANGNASASAAVQKTEKNPVKPPRNIQTGLSENMLLGFLFLLASGAFIVRSRKNA